MVAKALFTPRAVLRQNLKALMARKDGPATQGQLRRKSGVAQATIGRILSPEGVDAGIDTVAKIAKAYGLEAWQLMVAGMDPSNPPVLRAATKEEQELYDRLRDAAEALAKSKGTT
jgi:transcriptional regulator with XRE-family HTH domain